MSEAWIIDGVRSPRGGGKPGVGSLTHIHPQRILAQVLNALKDHAGFDPADVEDDRLDHASEPSGDRTLPTSPGRAFTDTTVARGKKSARKN